jgi:hypothetical protein
VFRGGKGRTKALYQLSFKSKRMLTSIYKKLNGEEIPTSPPAPHKIKCLKEIHHIQIKFTEI